MTRGNKLGIVDIPVLLKKLIKNRTTKTKMSRIWQWGKISITLFMRVSVYEGDEEVDEVTRQAMVVKEEKEKHLQIMRNMRG